MYVVTKFDHPYLRYVYWTGEMGGNRTPRRTPDLDEAQVWDDPADAYREAGRFPKLADWRVVRCDSHTIARAL